jgi:hypothetical protein
MTIMFIPITSLEFVHGVGLLDVAIHWKAPTSYHFLFVVALMSDMVSGVLGVPFQPFKATSRRPTPCTNSRDVIGMNMIVI